MANVVHVTCRKISDHKTVGSLDYRISWEIIGSAGRLSDQDQRLDVDGFESHLIWSSLK